VTSPWFLARDQNRVFSRSRDHCGVPPPPSPGPHLFVFSPNEKSPRSNNASEALFDIFRPGRKRILATLPIPAKTHNRQRKAPSVRLIEEATHQGNGYLTRQCYQTLAASGKAKTQKRKGEKVLGGKCVAKESGVADSLPGFVVGTSPSPPALRSGLPTKRKPESGVVRPVSLRELCLIIHNSVTSVSQKAKGNQPP
jgi:hypothetical protein